LLAVGKKYRKKIDPLHQLALSGRLEIHYDRSFKSNINVRIGLPRVVAIVSLWPYFEPDIEKDGILKVLFIKQETG